MLTFEPVTHTYRWHGHEKPSVTQILKAVYPDQHAGIPRAILERKAALGVAVHAAIELDLVGALDGYELHPDTVPYVESWRKWKQTVEIEIEGLEEQFYSPLGYCGTVDFRGRVGFAGMQKIPMLIDWKTTLVPMASHRIQTAGYKLGHGSAHSYTRACLYLHGDGGIGRLEKHEDESDVADWMATLRVYNIMERMK